ncbi:hypothetical protein L873DRAFT_1841615 [Choiromyces venosus 120613-1]|uniref:Uncharacterized protein n=1 Tax=Choiromyces venosus 120613-1 TaxID=1336337 RepID=A0A3N4JWM6_9PEZI|nr:hypothetical protein L873DRAFT_1841615 [Choiromyces venosus 120613-1]
MAAPLPNSPSTLHPNVSTSQTVPTFYTPDYQVEYNYSGENTSIHSKSALSSTPSGVLTSTTTSYSSHGYDNLSQQYSHTGSAHADNYMSVLSSFLSKKKSREARSFFLMENGNGNVYTFLINFLLCLGLPEKSPIYTYQSTKNMKNPLASIYGITIECPDGLPTGQIPGQAGASHILAAFATIKPQIEFNSDSFKQFLTRWILVTNTPF